MVLGEALLRAHRYHMSKSCQADLDAAFDCKGRTFNREELGGEESFVTSSCVGINGRILRRARPLELSLNTRALQVYSFSNWEGCHSKIQSKTGI